jgi:hypothetical protein
VYCWGHIKFFKRFSIYSKLLKSCPGCLYYVIRHHLIFYLVLEKQIELPKSVNNETAYRNIMHIIFQLCLFPMPSKVWPSQRKHAWKYNLLSVSQTRSYFHLSYHYLVNNSSHSQALGAESWPWRRLKLTLEGTYYILIQCRICSVVVLPCVSLSSSTLLIQGFQCYNNPNQLFNLGQVITLFLASISHL